LERTGAGPSAPQRCRCCAGIDFATGVGTWDPPSCILLRNDDGTAIGWCKRCSKAIRAVVADKPYGEPGPWRVARAAWGELPV
jgi:hypothetical protein